MNDTAWTRAPASLHRNVGEFGLLIATVWAICLMIFVVAALTFETELSLGMLLAPAASIAVAFFAFIAGVWIIERKAQ